MQSGTQASHDICTDANRASTTFCALLAFFTLTKNHVRNTDNNIYNETPLAFAKLREQLFEIHHRTYSMILL